MFGERSRESPLDNQAIKLQRMQTIQANKNRISFGQFEKQSGNELKKHTLPRQQTLHQRSQSITNIKSKKLGAGLDDEIDAAMNSSIEKLNSL